MKLPLSFSVASLLAAAAFVVGTDRVAASDASKAPEKIVDMPPVNVPIVDDVAFLGQLQVRTSLAFTDPAKAAIASERAATLKDAHLIAVTGFARLRADPRRAVDIERLAAALDAANARAGVDGARVLIREVKAV